MANQTLNQDGIEQCIVRMREALSAGDSAQATKFMEKAQRMGAPASRLQNVLKEFDRPPPKPAPKPASSSTSDSTFRQRTSQQRDSGSNSYNNSSNENSQSRSATGGSQSYSTSSNNNSYSNTNTRNSTGYGNNGNTTSSSSHARSSQPAAPSRPKVEPPKKAYTQEEAQLVRRILSTKDYYTTLNLKKEDKPSADQIKRARNKVALKLHPDKTGAPNAEAAMQKVNKAYECLSDDKKRSNYDRFGTDTSSASSGGGGQQYQGDDIFEIFRQGFFGHQGGRRGGGQGDMQGPPVWLLGIMLMFLFSALTNLLHSQPMRKYSLNRDVYFPIPKTSRRLKAQYFVSQSFDKDYPDKSQQRKDIDHHVELDFIRNTQSECEYEERRLWRQVINARLKADPDERNREIARAKAKPRKSCEKLEGIKEQYPNLFKAAVGENSYGYGDL